MWKRARKKEEPGVPRGAWRAEINVRATELHHRLAVAGAVKSECWPQCQTQQTRGAIAAAARESLATAKAATAEIRGFSARASDWRTGAAVTTAWESIHEAEINVMRIESSEAIWTNISKLLVWIQQAMDSGYLRARHETTLKAQLEAHGKEKGEGTRRRKEKEADPDRAAVEQAVKDVVIANRERYVSVRAFRNILALVTTMLAGLVVLLAAWHAANPDFLNLCSMGEAVSEQQCLSGEDSQRSDVALVALVGAVGGFMAVAFRLAETESTPTRYDPGVWQTILKPVAGAATAIAGVLLIQANIVTVVVSSHTEALLLSYALVLGFSQQLFTRFVDKRADTLITAE